MKIFGNFCLLVIFAFTSLAHAEIFKYQDQHGNWIHTDNIDQVPMDKRSKVKAIKDPDLIPPLVLSDKNQKKSPTAEPADEKKQRQTQQEQLETEKEALDKELDFLLAESAKLKKAQKTAVTREQVKSVNHKTKNFNARFNAYQKKKTAFKAQVETFYKDFKPSKTQN